MIKQEDIQRLIGSVIRNERIKKKLTQSELAERSKLDNTYISQIERGLVNPSIYSLHKITWSLDLTEYDVFQKIRQELSGKDGLIYESGLEMKSIYHAIGNLSASIILTTTKDDDFRIIYCNDAFLKFTNSTRKDLMGKKINSILSDKNDNNTLQYFLDYLGGIFTQRNFIERSNKNGANEEFELHVSPVLSKENNIESYLFTVQNNADLEIKRADGSSEIEKYKLLIENNNHRIKNTLSVLVGTIDISLHKENNDEVKYILKDTKMRLNSVANVYEMLLNYEEGERIDLKTYMNKLIKEITNTYRTNNEIVFEKEIEIQRADIDDSIALCLLCSELITNSYKYAFPVSHDQEKKIRLLIKHESNKTILFRFQDNGIGFDEKLFEEAESPGLSLIHVLLDQLKAKKIYTENENGFKLEFEIHTN